MKHLLKIKVNQSISNYKHKVRFEILTVMTYLICLVKYFCCRTLLAHGNISILVRKQVFPEIFYIQFLTHATLFLFYLVRQPHGNKVQLTVNTDKKNLQPIIKT